MVALGEFALIEAQGMPSEVRAGTITAVGNGLAPVDFKADTHEGESNRQRLAELLLPAQLAWLSLEHGTSVAVLDHMPSQGEKVVADAAILTKPGSALAFTTADCVPIIVSLDPAVALAVIHAGWRSLAGGIIERAVEALLGAAAVNAGMDENRDIGAPGNPQIMMLETQHTTTSETQHTTTSETQHTATPEIQFNAAPASNRQLHAWIGPAIDQANYEIDNATYERLLSRPAVAAQPELCFTQNRPGHWLADLPRMAELILLSCGLVHENIWRSGLSTYTHPDLHSARRDGKNSGRMATFALL